MCDIEEFMALRKVERLNELDLDKKPKVETPKQETPSKKQDTSVDNERKQLQSKLKKIEETIEKLEKEIKVADEKLVDQANYEKLMNDKVFFTNYSQLKHQLETELTKWEEVSNRLNS